MLYFIFTITPLLSVPYIGIPHVFESLLYTTWLLQKTCICTCFHYWEKIGRIFPLHKKLQSSFSICFAGALLEAAHSPVSKSCSVAQSYPTLYNPMNCSTSGFPDLHYLPEFVQTHVYSVSDAIQPSHPPPPPSLAFNLSQPFLLLCANGKRTMGVFENPAEPVSDQIIRLISIYQALNIPHKLF